MDTSSSSSSSSTNSNSNENQIPFTISVHAFDWELEDAATSCAINEKATIHAWCLNQSSQPCLLRFSNFPVYANLELPILVDRRIFRWNKDSALTVVKYLRYVLKDDGPSGFMFKPVRKLYYYRNKDLSPMILLLFPSIKGMYSCKNLLGSPRKIPNIGMGQFNLWETEISPIRKMLTLRQCKYSQWFEIQATHIPEYDRVSTLANEYLVDYSTLNPLSQEVTAGWSTNPGILAFDIEAYSDNHKSMPISTSAKHVAYMISAIYQKANLPHTRKRHLIIYGDCEPIENTEIYIVKSEYELCNKLCDIIALTDPDVIIGYNIFEFDYPYLHNRLRRKGHEWKVNASRIVNRKPYMPKPIRWKSSGYGYVNLSVFHFPGRISVDLLPVIKRDYKLKRFNLDTVANYFLGRGKHDVKPDVQFKMYEQLETTTSLYLRCVKKWDMVIDNKEENKITPVFHDNISPNVITEVISRYEKCKQDETIVCRYCLEDSELVMDLFDKINAWIGMVELSSILGVSIMDVFIRGQQIRGLSQVYDLAAINGYVIDTRTISKAIKWSGGFVMEPISGLYDLVLCFDFKSLYPSIIQAYNICYTTLVPPELDHLVPDDMCHVIEWDENPEDGNPLDDAEEVEVEVEPDKLSSIDEDEDLKPKAKENKKIPLKHCRLSKIVKVVGSVVLAINFLTTLRSLTRL